uniref:Uncharacterized protein n=1 Tax=Meloidogyne javanica TaxID=6303 RepID=A0A915MNK7_MELJA
MSVPSDGSYQGLGLDDFAKQKIELTTMELTAEREDANALQRLRDEIRLAKKGAAMLQNKAMIQNNVLAKRK